MEERLVSLRHSTSCICCSVALLPYQHAWWDSHFGTATCPTCHDEGLVDQFLTKSRRLRLGA